MRSWFSGVLCACLVACVAGCSSERPRTTAEYCARYGCPESAGAPLKLAPAVYRPTRTAKRKNDTHVRRVAVNTKSKLDETTAVTKTLPSQTENARKDPVADSAPPPAEPPVASIPQSPPSELVDPVVKKAQEIVAAKMRNPAAIEFHNVRRVSKSTAVGKAIDSVCGRIKGQRAADGRTGEWPFVYLVDEDKAYIVDDNPDTMAGISYRNICGAPRPKKVGEISAT